MCVSDFVQECAGAYMHVCFKGKKNSIEEHVNVNNAGTQKSTKCFPIICLLFSL